MIKIENQDLYLNSPVMPRSYYNVMETPPEQVQPKNNPNPFDVTQGILDRMRDLAGQGAGVIDAINGNAQVNFGDDITITPYDQNQDNQKNKIFGMPKSIVIAGAITIVVIGGGIAIALISKKRSKTKKLNTNVNI